ncbi:MULTISPECIES: LptF/LptG family permease [unclassified Lebetimonas]|uniref:LptF/LptG family permease n=1 Tax=unclassified Lebetimonas TaxID=2648158 RepID=UPI0004660212|nr:MULTISPECIES: LptF/LptG family permease [unclassified Lebetimonas]
MFFLYILKKFSKNFFLFLFSLSFLYLLLDLIGNFSKLPHSSNLLILYSVYVISYSFENFYPLALIFSFLYTVYHFIKFNTLVSFYSLGFSKNKILFVFLIFSLSVYFIFIALDNTNYVYFNQKAQNILLNKKLKKENLFLKYKNSIVYIKELKPLLKKAYCVKIFTLEGTKVKKIINIKEAEYKNNKWMGNNVTIEMFDKNRLIIKKENHLNVLTDFEPLVLSNLKKLESISIKDALLAMKIFKSIKLNKIISILMFKILTPLSLILFLIYLMYSAPVHQRISSISFFLIKSVFFSVFLWGANLLLYKFVKQGVINPFILTLPLFFVLVLDIYVIKKEN